MIEINDINDITLALRGTPPRAHADAEKNEFTITVQYFRAQNAGETICIGVELADKVRNLSELRRYTVQTTLFSDLSLSRGVITAEKLSEIEHVASLSAAWQKGLNILAYGSNSAQALTLKLRQRGFDANTATRAVDLIRAQGYLQEDSDARREAERCLNKGWGLRRIGQHLRQRGYENDAITNALASLGNEDFDERCCFVARKYHATPPEDAKQRQKIIAYLLRYGYDMNTIRHALDHAWVE